MSRLAALLQKPWYVQFALSALVALLLYAPFWWLVTSPIREETKNTQAQVDNLRGENARAQAAAQRLNEFKASFARAQSDYADLKALLPEQRELTNVLQGIQDRARGRLMVTRFTPKDDVQQDYFSGKPVEVEVSSSYNKLGAFFAQMAAYQRIVSITDFKLTRMKEQAGGDKTLDAQFLLTAYYVSNEKLQSAAKPAAKPATPAAPHAPEAK
ncbi:MAG: type 4a pilus biogenesis protein PilO [Acidobacteria bacterium]|nr:type 4a pilus biogenesis protein PilO [Acidobacteriota bacterium]MCA1640497.1 type 4a pilus biogenesis protein PilO [Acidobacteriota bacterium]